MRNWPYAYSLLQDPSAIERGRSIRGRAAAGADLAERRRPHSADPQLAINAFSEQPDAAYQLIDYLLQPAQMIERARVAGQFPPRPALYTTRRAGRRTRHSTGDARQIIERAVAAAGHAGVQRVVRDPPGLAAPRAHPSAGSPPRAAGRRRLDAPRCW